MTTLDRSKLSTSIVRTLFRDAMRTDITDPAAARRPARSKFVMTSFPSRDVFYPVIVAAEAGDSGGRIDGRNSLTRHRYSVEITVYGATTTEMLNLRDAVRGWLEGEWDTFAAAGYTDVEIVSSSKATWSDSTDASVWRLVVSGNAYAAEA